MRLPSTSLLRCNMNEVYGSCPRLASTFCCTAARLVRVCCRSRIAPLSHAGLLIPTTSCCRCRPGTASRCASTGCCARRSSASCPAFACAQRCPASDGELALAHDARLRSARWSRARSSAAQQREIGFPWTRARWSSARGARSARPSRRRARRCAARASPPTWPAAPTTPTPTRAAATASSTTSAVAARLMQAEWHRTPAPAAARRGHRPRRAPGQRHRGDLRRRPDGVHAVAARREELSVPQGGAATSTSNCPTAAATPPTWRRWTPRWPQLWARQRERAARAGLLPGRRRPARGRPARPPQAEQPTGWPSATAACSPRCASARIPVALSMAGGYGRDIEDTVAVQLAHPGAGACDSWRQWQDDGDRRRMNDAARDRASTRRRPSATRRAPSTPPTPSMRRSRRGARCAPSCRRRCRARRSRTSWRWPRARLRAPTPSRGRCTC